MPAAAAPHVQAGSEELTGALDALSLEPGVHHGLRGLPTRERRLAVWSVHATPCCRGRHPVVRASGEALLLRPHCLTMLRTLPPARLLQLPASTSGGMLHLHIVSCLVP